MNGNNLYELQCHSFILPQIGLVEQEWLATLATINAEEVTFTDYVERGRELATSLKNEVCKLNYVHLGLQDSVLVNWNSIKQSS